MKNQKTYHSQTAKFISSILTCLPKEITTDVMQGWIDNSESLKKALKEALCPPVEVEKVSKKLLKFLGIVVVKAMKKFIVKDEFVAGKNDIDWIGENFEKWFLNMVEEPVKKTKLRQNTLVERSVDNPIIAELGGKKKVGGFLSQILYLMKNVLKKDGTVYVFYKETTVFSKDEEHLAYENKNEEKEVLRTVYVHWFYGGWRVYTDTVEDPRKWDVGYVLFSRNS